MIIPNNHMLNMSFVALATIIFTPNKINAMVPRDAVGQAVYSNPEIKSFESEARAVEHQIAQERSGYFPTVDAEHGSGWEVTEDNFKVNELNSAPQKGTVDETRHQPTIRVVQPIFSGFDTVHRVQKKEDEFNQANKKTEEIAVLRAFAAYEAYVGVRRFQRLWRLSTENVKKHKEILRKVRALVKGGKASKGDLHTVEARLQDAQTAVNDIIGDLSTAIANFINETGITPDRLENAKIDDEVLPQSLEEALDLALENNRSVVLAKANIAVTKTDVKVAESPFYPTLNFEADARHSRNVSAKKGYENNAKALFVVRWNLLRGGSDLYRHKEFKERIVKAKDDLRSALRTAEREVRVSWGERASAALQAATLRKAVKAKKLVVNTFTKQFDLGKVSLLDLLDVVNEWFLAKGSLITADATQDLTEARLLAACGIILTAFDIPYSGIPFANPEITEGLTPTEKLVDQIVKGEVKFQKVRVAIRS